MVHELHLKRHSTLKFLSEDTHTQKSIEHRLILLVPCIKQLFRLNLSVDSSSKASSDWVSAYKNKNIKLQLDTYFAAEIWQCMKTRLTICVQMH